MSDPVKYTRLPRTTLWLLRGDEFTMGGDGADEQPRFEAEPRAIYIGKAPITNRQYEAFDPQHQRPESSLGDDTPVVCVSFAEAQAYCRWYSQASGKDFRLPTELEWEFACRAGSSSRFFWGDSLEKGDPFVWDVRTSGGACHPIETSDANEFGLHDMAGNVWEWTSSLHMAYPVVSGDGREVLDAPGDRVTRGGSFRDSREFLASSVRRSMEPSSSADNLGFRIVRFL